MLWEVEIRPLGRDGDRERVCDEFDLLTHGERGGDLIRHAARGFLLEGASDLEAARTLTRELLVDSVVETATLCEIGQSNGAQTYTVLLKPGVMDPVAESVLEAASDLGVPLQAVRTFRRYFGSPEIDAADRDILFRKVLANDAIEQIVVGSLRAEHLALGKPYRFQLTTLPIRDLDDAALIRLSKEGQLALSLEEMRTIQAHFRQLGRDATDAELESVAQTWSEHCSHKTLKGTIEYTETVDGRTTTKHFGNLLKETIFGATVELRKRFGPDDWCVSVFVDNAGVIKFDDDYHACFKVETHNRPSAIEPYGGANTGLGGVIRDVLGTGLAGKPVCNTDVFCFARPDYPIDRIPPGVLHPRRVMNGVVAGVKDYGNRMGIPTVNGSVIFDDRYLANPLVFCGTVGLVPTGKADKEVRDGDLIVAVGGRTGRDGIHGATFSSLELTSESEKISGGAVQIGNAIAEKKVLDVVLQARDLGLYNAVTDCGAGGFSSAVGEMGADLGAHVELEKAPLKYAGLSYTEIWISESQERMVLAVPKEKWPDLEALCKGEGVEAAILGTFEKTGRLKLTFEGHLVADLAMEFLHDGRPNGTQKATYTLPAELPHGDGETLEPVEVLKRILGSYSVCSKESIVRQYDHEVQGGSVIKPLTGVMNDGPSDAAVVMPVMTSTKGLAVSNGLNPRYGDLDPYWMTACAIDEAVRNAVAVGADPARIAILDNFCWGNINDPSTLGSLVRTAEACRDLSLAFGTPFISGKDSLNNEFRSADRHIAIPGTLLISALGMVHDVRQCVTMDLKEPGNDLYLVGIPRDELGGSHFNLVTGATGGSVPKVDVQLAPKIFRAVHHAITNGMVRACHDLSEGGFAVAIAEMAFSGGIGADITDLATTAPTLSDQARLFGESPTRFVIEAPPAAALALATTFVGLPLKKIGTTVKEPRLRIAGANGEWRIWTKLDALKDAWQKPLKAD
jgi:phosphoribosylformylglycinamidine synthase subunit PurSL